MRSSNARSTDSDSESGARIITFSSFREEYDVHAARLLAYNVFSAYGSAELYGRELLNLQCWFLFYSFEVNKFLVMWRRYYRIGKEICKWGVYF